MPVDRTPFEKALTKAGLTESFIQRLPVAEVFGGDEETIWIRNAKEFGWHEKWTEYEGVHIPYGCAPTKHSPTVKPEETKVRDKRIKLNSADREELLRWTQAAIGTDPECIHEEDIPSGAHIAMLEFANSDHKTFWQWIAELDKRKAEEAQSGKVFRDDQRRLFAVMDQVIEDRERTAKQQTETSV